MIPDSQNTAFVLVPGGFCPGSLYHRVTDRLVDLGYPVHEVDLPSVGKRKQGPASAVDDSNYISSIITYFADQGKDVIVCGLAYGCFVSTVAAKGVTKAEREAVGRPGGLVHFVFMATLLAPLGVTVYELVSGEMSPMIRNAPDYIDPPDFEHGLSYFCSDLDETQQKFYQAKLKCQSAKTFAGKMTYEGYKYVPTTVVVTTNDKTLAPEWQHENVDAAIAKGIVTIRKMTLHSDHCAMISHSEDILAILFKAASGEDLD